MARISHPSVPNYTTERVSFGRYKTHELQTPKATVKYKTQRVPMENFPVVIMETNAEIAFEGHPTARGFARFRSYREKGMYGYLRTRCFLQACDTHTQGMYDLACALTASFNGDIEELFAMGSIMEFERLHVPQHLDGQRLWTEPINALLQILVQTYDPILLVLKPYPLAYESMGGTNPTQRIKALGALYRRTLGVDYLGKSEYMGKGLGGFEVRPQKCKWFLV